MDIIVFLSSSFLLVGECLDPAPPDAPEDIGMKKKLLLIIRRSTILKTEPSQNIISPNKPCSKKQF